MKPIVLFAVVFSLMSCGPRTSSKGKSNATNPNNTIGVNNTTNSNNANNTTSTNNTVPPNNGSCDGCISAGVCVGGDSADACGGGGAECFACVDGWACFDGECIQPPSCSDDTCSGCCDPVAGCVMGNDDDACGNGGAVCSTCVGNESCDGTICVAPCAETCAGCCMGETCLAGSAAGACGTAGAACEDCGAGSSCSAQSVCVADACSSNCAGCCDGSTCQTGTDAGACGASGDACIACGQGRTCMNKMCVTNPTSRWEVVLVSGAVSTNNQMGEPWDVIGSPDPVVDFELYDATTMTAYRNTSSIIQDDTTPTWNESVLTDVPAAAFLSWRIDVWDSDFDFDDPICSIDVDLSGDPATYQDLFSGAVYTFSCSDPATGVFADLNIRLQ